MADSHARQVMDDETYQMLRKAGASKGKAGRFAQAAGMVHRNSMKQSGRAEGVWRPLFGSVDDKLIL